MTVEELQQLKQKIEALKQQKAQYEGKLQLLLKSLNEMGYSSVEEAKSALTELKQKKETLEKQKEELETKILALLEEVGI